MRRRKSIFSLRRAAGFTIIEAVMAVAISAVTGIGATTVFVLASRFIAQGYTETRILHNASLTLEEMSRKLNHAYRSDATTAANRFTIAADKRSIEFSAPAANGTDERLRYRFNSSTNELLYERSENGGSFSGVSGRPLLREVDEFLIENQEGILSLVLSMEVDMKRNGMKRYTMVGRALPRNL